MSKEGSVHSRHRISGLRRKNRGKTTLKQFKNAERGTTSRPNKSGWCRIDCYPQPKPMNQCTTSLTGDIPDLCASSHLFSSAQPPIHLPYIQNNGLYCLAVAADLVLTSSTDVLHCCAIPAVLTHASALFAVHTAQFSFESEAIFFLSSTSKSMLLACHWTADGFCCILFSNPLPICSTKCAYIYVNLIFFSFPHYLKCLLLWFTTNLSGKIYFPQVWELIKLHYSSVVISVLFLFPSDESFPWKPFFVHSYIRWDDFGCVKKYLCAPV